MKKTLVTAVLGVAAAAVIAGPAPTAAADTQSELAYISSLNALGIIVYDAPLAIDSGYRICALRESLSEVDTAIEVFRQSSWATAPTMQSAAGWVVAAEMNLCPQHFVPPTYAS